MARLRGAGPAGGELPAVLRLPEVGDWIDYPADVADVPEGEERWEAARVLAYARWRAARQEWAELHGGLSEVNVRRRFGAELAAAAVTADGLLNDGERREP